jgi:hypothetical protein
MSAYVADGAVGIQARAHERQGLDSGTIPRKVSTAEGVAMAGKSPRKTNAKKQGKTLKEKQAAKKLEKVKRRETSHIPPTGH